MARKSATADKEAQAVNTVTTTAVTSATAPQTFSTAGSSVQEVFNNIKKIDQTDCCKLCIFWSRIHATSFGECSRWSHLSVETRGGLETGFLKPMTTDTTTCSEFKKSEA